MIEEALIIFTRIPIPGKVKTRLVGSLSIVDCAAIQAAMIADLFQKLQPLTQKRCDVFVCYSDEGEPSHFLKEMPTSFTSFPQKGQNIGERMFEAFQTLFARGYQRVVLIGSDIPGVTMDRMITALTRLMTNEVVIGPSVDGGYYLIGAQQQDLSYLFLETDLSWGEGSVFQETLTKIAKANKSVCQVETLGDIDYHQDLIGYKAIKLPENYRLNQWLRQNQRRFIWNG
ncbi:TIGR04282 family arsenosugar biosynthesis glycosyltransferase [Vagococcus sp. BWB3-3]|uniref:TIGR04282 family arsenosugar biosynthesis glycosyltransferase n=1 Tax=Vagococcus allomyrinae TaxID=2794353 RepID=A0A940P5X2_9ENTE|nr:TIGR04282 family arsenosugar biosynthesis glycosyltransferase [Vagococcus allomyrinae]MBP1042199.1 TIGR04282 family arsenosugar biosynthesis glycosyltransferase [Vagococcus allomyrinae]